MKRFLWLIPIAAVIGLDQLTKWLVVTNMNYVEAPPHSIPVIDGILNFTYIHNDGAAMGILDDHRWVFMVASTLAIIAICVFMFVYYNKYYHPFLYLSLSFIVGGGIGNMIDRTALGYVVDFIDVRFIPFWEWIFNVADSFVCVGCAMVILYILISDQKAKRKTDLGDNPSQN